MSITKVTNDNIASLEASKLTGSFPSIDGSNLTNMSSFTKSSSDPAIDTNPSGSTGTLWLNTTSGEMFCCTDATTDANVWTNVGAGSGNFPADNVTRGSISGYTAGGENTTGAAHSNVIDKFSYVSDANATDVGNLVEPGPSGSLNSGTYGYACKYASGNGTVGTMSKWAFASDADAVAGGSAHQGTNHTNGCSGHMSPTNGYWVGGYPSNKAMSKFSFANEDTKSTPGNLSDLHGAGNAGSSHFDYGGFAFGNYPNHFNIDKFSFASDGDATTHAQLTAQMRDMTGSNGETHAYYCMGYTSGYLTDIAKFPYASQTNAVNVADMGFSTQLCSGTASTTHGYTAGGTRGGKHNVITKYSQVSDGNGVDVGDLTEARSHFSGTGATH